MATASAAAPVRVHPLRLFSWHRPEWPWAMLVAGAWFVLAMAELTPGKGALTHGMAMQGMNMSASAGSAASGAHGHHHHALSAGSLGWWMLMTFAMMVPATLPVLREISFQSMWPRRYRSPALFLAGYLAVWAAIVVVALAGWSLVTAVAPATATFGMGIALFGAAAWSLSERKRRYLRLCHRFLPLAPRGRAANGACLRFGVYHARQCAGACWPVMLAMLPEHALVSMLGLTALVTWERLARLPHLRISALLLAVASVATIVLAA